MALCFGLLNGASRKNVEDEAQTRWHGTSEETVVIITAAAASGRKSAATIWAPVRRPFFPQTSTSGSESNVRPNESIWANFVSRMQEADGCSRT